MNRTLTAPWYQTRTYTLPRTAHLHITPKLVFDILSAGVALVLLSPLLLLTALAIKWESKGPVFFTQTRYGWDNRPFRIYKFRTMWAHLGDASGVSQTTEDDPRITPLGAFLRRTNIDELPQLLNVIKGDMSLVGPRPHAVGMLAGGALYEDLVAIADRRSIRCMRGCACGLISLIAAATAWRSISSSSSRHCAVKSSVMARGSDVSGTCFPSHQRFRSGAP